MNAQSITPVGGSQPHDNMQPYLCINFIISLFGIFPTPDLGGRSCPIHSSPRSASSPFNFAPTGWALCNGQLLPISQNTALFSLLGTTYGGDGKSTFALPDLEGIAAMHPGQGPGLSLRDLGELGGTEFVTLLQSPKCRSTRHALMGGNIPATSSATRHRTWR